MLGRAWRFESSRPHLRTSLLKVSHPLRSVNTWARPYWEIEAYSYSNAWPCLFPQHGPGKKHLRRIVLTRWQERSVRRAPELLLRGLIHSDGCRFVNTGRCLYPGVGEGPDYNRANNASQRKYSMGILRDFEHRLERIVEGFFTKAFRSGLQPVELAKRVLREMEAGKTVGVREVWVPNRYVLRLSDEDRGRLAGMEKALGRELERVVTDGARERGFGLVARPEVVFETDEGLRRGEFDVASELTEETGAPPTDGEAPPGRPVLVLLEGASKVKEFPLERDTALIGRLAGSEVEISDPGASRRHAEVRRQGDGFVIVDLGSTNGTLVNDDPVSERALEDGDRITIGQTTLEFRKG